MTDRERVAPQWMFHHNGVYGPAEEHELRQFGERLGIFSDQKGIASGVMSQMWAEIDRLRAALSASPWLPLPAEVVEGVAPWDSQRYRVLTKNYGEITAWWRIGWKEFTSVPGEYRVQPSHYAPIQPLPAPPAGEA